MRRLLISVAIYLIAMVVVFCVTSPAHAADRCHDKAAMYQLVYNLRDAKLSDDQVLAYTWMYQGVTEAERLTAIYRVRPTGDLGAFTAKTLYRHVYLECRGGA